MAEYSAVATLSTPGGNITFNDTGSTGHHDPEMCEGLDPQSAVRSVQDDRPRTHGGIVYDRLYGPRAIVLGGWCLATTVANREAFFNSLGAALDSIMDGGGTYSWVASTGTKTITSVFCDVPVKSMGGFMKRYQFGLISPNYAIS